MPSKKRRARQARRRQRQAPAAEVPAVPTLPPDWTATRASVEVLKRVILSKYPGAEFRACRPEENPLIPDDICIVYFHKRCASSTISVGQTWRIIARDLDQKSAPIPAQPPECSVCCESSYDRVSCHKCVNAICLDCYVSIFLSGKGVITCPFCRYRVGEELAPRLLLRRTCEVYMKTGRTPTSSVREKLFDMWGQYW